MRSFSAIAARAVVGCVAFVCCCCGIVGIALWKKKKQPATAATGGVHTMQAPPSAVAFEAPQPQQAVVAIEATTPDVELKVVDAKSPTPPRTPRSASLRASLHSVLRMEAAGS